MRYALLLAVVLLCCCGPGNVGAASSGGPPAPAATERIFYVDANSGRDSNDGRSPATAFKTLNRAASAVTPGWTVRVMTGTYSADDGSDPLTVTTSGTPDAPIRFTAADGQHPVIRITRKSWNGIHVLGASYVSIEGFEVAGLGDSISAADAAVNDGTQPWLNHNCIFVDGVGSGNVHPAVPHDIAIRDNVLHHCTAAGIEVNVGDAITIERNRVFDNAWWTRFGTSGIGLYHLTDVPGSGSSNGYKNVIARNESYGNRNYLPYGDGDVIYDGNGIIVDDSMHVQPALGTHDVQGVPYGGRTWIANNLVHDNGGRGIHANLSEHVDMVNNTAWNDLLTDSKFIDRGEIGTYGGADIQIVNNIAQNLVGKEVTLDDEKHTASNRFDSNLWDGVLARLHGDTDLLTAARLVDPAKGNFAPGPDSPALRSGTQVRAPSDDFFGNPRKPGAIDRGAVQVTR
jgi:hypothetical protein